jgi:diguanylate cyclase (GGDEF)-like protein
MTMDDQTIIDSSLDLVGIAAQHLPVVSVVHGKDKGKLFVISKPGTVLGRDAEVDIPLDDYLVSRKHLSVTYANTEDGGEFGLKDLATTNGSFLDQGRFDTCTIKPGQTVQIGKTVLAFSLKNKHEVESSHSLFEKATIDPLTGVANRRWFMSRAEEEFSFTQKKGVPLCLAMADVDHFKKINDSYGHQAGDHVLREVASLLKGSVRGHDYVGRYGGEEFILLLKELPPDRCEPVIERMRASVENAQFVFKEQPLSVTMSFGVYPVEVQLGLSVEQAIAIADERLYRAKEGGRNRVICSD